MKTRNATVEQLTPREWEVLALVREGLTNEQIAERLSISRDGAKYHVSEILTKLGLPDRIEAARWYDRETSRAPFLALLFGWLRRPSGGLLRIGGLAAIGVCVLAFAALLAGLLVMRSRGAPEPSAGMPLATAEGVIEVRFVTEWGSPGSGEGQFDRTRFMALGQDGNVYVADWGNHRVQYFSPDGAFLGEWGGSGAEPGQMTNPTGIAVDDEGFVYVSALGAFPLQKFTSSGEFVETVGETFIPTYGITLDEQGNLYGPDIVRGGISMLDGDGKVLKQWEVAGHPAGSFIGEDGYLYVTDWDSGRVYVFTPEGELLRELGTPGYDLGELNKPFCIAADEAGHLYVADSGNDRVQVFDSDDRFLDAWGSTGEGAGEFYEPYGIIVEQVTERRVRIWVGDEWRIQVFEADLP